MNNPIIDYYNKTYPKIFFTLVRLASEDGYEVRLVDHYKGRWCIKLKLNDLALHYLEPLLNSSVNELMNLIDIVELVYGVGYSEKVIKRVFDVNRGV